ncbi:MAG: thiamine diphosphokinase [Desulfobacteraceae bacterium]|nr:thiamine diphosphokinase [Desulfobacteraceae bacterium]
MNCIIVASGNLLFNSGIKSLLKKADLIIAADGGASHLKQMNIPPHFIIGDMDSIHQDTRLFFEKNLTPIITYPSRKDSTDTDLCIDFALQKGATAITLLGATGTRLDHTLANIFLLRRLADLGVESRIMDANNEIYLVTDHLKLYGKKGEFLSVIPISDKVTGLTLTGLEYPLENASIPMGSSLGISNYFKKTCATISITTGVLLVTKSRD